MQDEQVNSRTDFLTTRCIPNLVSSKMSKKHWQHLLYKSSLREKISKDDQCSFVETNEVLNPDLKIDHPLTLPSSCLYLEFDVSENQIQPVECNFTKRVTGAINKRYINSSRNPSTSQRRSDSRSRGRHYDKEGARLIRREIQKQQQRKKILQ